ncbi:MAG: family 78 glycoside hydrolase catalytic domain, partial [Clostridia bacterium]|nr:family 78 glycoside hydrolase catalytic domain [Clostridia bacterium]
MNWVAEWLKPARDMVDAAPVFLKKFELTKPVHKAVLYVTAMGVYEAELNGQRVGDFLMAPGWTSYQKRLQYQKYDVSALLKENNELFITVGKGWYHSHLMDWEISGDYQKIIESPLGLLAQLVITGEDGQEQVIGSDGTWAVSEGPVRFAEIYDGEIYNANIKPDSPESVEVFDGPWDTLIPQQGEVIRAQERLAAARIFLTPKGETLVDFGQVVTGHVKVEVDAGKGDVVDLSFGEVLDREGNFYNDNYRNAKCQYHYICRDGKQAFEPQMTFYGFRYIDR